MATTLDELVQRPRKLNYPYTQMTEEQIGNVGSTTKVFSEFVKKRPDHVGRCYNDRYCKVISPHMVRGPPKSYMYGWIGAQFQHESPEQYNTCRGRSSVRWGPNKAGERTRSHYMGETIDRYTMIDAYRRKPTAISGVTYMDCGRPGEGYYAQKYPRRYCGVWVRNNIW